MSKKNISRVKRLLREDVSESSALLVACQSGFIPLVSILLSSTFNGCSYEIVMAVKSASTIGQQDLLVLLFCAIDKVSERQVVAKQAYLYSLSADQIRVCKVLVLCGEVDVQYAFEKAADYAHPELLRWIIEKKGKDKFHGGPINHALYYILHYRLPPPPPPPRLSTLPSLSFTSAASSVLG